MKSQFHAPSYKFSLCSIKIKYSTAVATVAAMVLTCKSGKCKHKRPIYRRLLHNEMKFSVHLNVSNVVRFVRLLSFQVIIEFCLNSYANNPTD